MATPAQASDTPQTVKNHHGMRDKNLGYALLSINKDNRFRDSDYAGLEWRSPSVILFHGLKAPIPLRF